LQACQVIGAGSINSRI